MGSRSCLGILFGCFGPLLGSCWASLGRSWDALSRSWSDLGALRASSLALSWRCRGTLGTAPGLRSLLGTILEGFYVNGGVDLGGSVTELDEFGSDLACKTTCIRLRRIPLPCQGHPALPESLAVSKDSQQAKPPAMSSHRHVPQNVIVEGHWQPNFLQWHRNVLFLKTPPSMDIDGRSLVNIYIYIHIYLFIYLFIFIFIYLSYNSYYMYILIYLYTWQ